MTQKERIKELLSSGEWVDNWTFITVLKMSSYGQRINEMNKAGEIETEIKHDSHNSAKWSWRLKPKFKIVTEADGQILLPEVRDV